MDFVMKPNIDICQKCKYFGIQSRTYIHEFDATKGQFEIASWNETLHLICSCRNWDGMSLQRERSAVFIAHFWRKNNQGYMYRDAEVPMECPYRLEQMARTYDGKQRQLLNFLPKIKAVG